MTFLNPAVLIGLLAASIPVFIHLLNLRKLKKIEFSTLKFLNELQKNKIRRVKLKQWLLLALRVLIILLIVTAFARPTLEGVSLGGTSSAAKTTAVFILDDTFSMSVIGQDGSYFNHAKQVIRKLAGELQEGDEAALLLVSGNENFQIGLTSNISSFTSKLENIPLSDASGTLNSAIIKAADLISTSHNFNKELYLFTDFQKGRIADKNLIPDFKNLIDQKTRLYTFNFAKKQVYNIGIDDLKIKTQIFEKNKPVNFEVSVTNYSQEPADNLVVSLFVNSKRSAQQSINLKPGESGSVKLEANDNSTVFIDAHAELEDDDMLPDNLRFTSFYVPQKINVLLLYEYESDLQFVELALRLGESSGEFNLTKKRLSQINSIQTDKYGMAFICSDKVGIAKQKINEFMKQGKGVVIFPGSEKSGVNFTSSIKQFKLVKQASLVQTSNKSNSYVDFDKIDFNHPIFQNIFRNKEKKEIVSSKIFSYYKINTLVNGKPIIKLIDGSSFLSEFDFGNGKLFLFSVSPVLSWSDFPLKSIFVPLIYKSVFYLSSGENKNHTYIAGEPMNIDISRRTLPQIKVEKPGGKEELININSQDNSDFILYKDSFYEGIYKFSSGDKILETVSVNTDPKESATEYANKEEFENYLEASNFNGSHISVDLNTDITKVILQARFGSELWRYFLIAALILALIEMTIARSSKKDLIEIKQ